MLRMKMWIVILLFGSIFRSSSSFVLPKTSSSLAFSSSSAPQQKTQKNSIPSPFSIPSKSFSFSSSSTKTTTTTTTELKVSIGLGPSEEEQAAAAAAAEAAAAEVVEEPDHELYRTSRLSNLDKKCDDWFASLLHGIEEDDSNNKQSKPNMYMGSISEQILDKILTPIKLEDEPVYKHGVDPEWTPYVQRRLPGTPILPAYGLERFGIPIPRRGAEAWRHFDVAGMISQDYSDSPDHIGTNLELDEATTKHYQSILQTKGAWLNNDACSSRLIYINGRFCPTLSKVTSISYNLDPSSSSSYQQYLQRLPDGFTDRLAADVPSGKTDYLTSFQSLSGPDHNVGKPTSQFAINGQQGMACFAALNTIRTGAIALIDIPDQISSSSENNRNDENEKSLPYLVVNAQTTNAGSTMKNDNNNNNNDDNNDENEKKGVAFHPRLLVVAGESSHASIIQMSVDLYNDENEETEESRPKFYNGYTQIFLKANANITHSILEETGGIVTGNVEESNSNNNDDDIKKAVSSNQEEEDNNKNNNENKKDNDDNDVVLSSNPRDIESKRPALRDTHFETLDVHLTGDNAQYDISLMSLGGSGRSRIASYIGLLRPGATTHVNGYCLSGGAQRDDIRTCIHHIAQGTISRQKQRNMVGGRATAEFRGRIRVEQSAQQTDSQQLSRTILLNNKSKIWTVPTLEIIADDVQCTHGATVSDLSEEEVFYLQSRGLDQTTSRNLLMYAFADDIARTVDNAIQGSKKDDDSGSDRSLRNRVIRRLQNLVPQGERAVQGEFQSI